MQHAILRSRTTQVPWLRNHWIRIEYACREADGSLKPVPPGTTRRELYCRQCKAVKCLFGKTARERAITMAELARQEAEEQEKQRQKYEQDKIRKRARGLNTSSRPLQQTCWNCCNLRIKLAGYVCRHEPEAEPEAEPATRGKMIHRYAHGCQNFGWRREVEIPPLESE